MTQTTRATIGLTGPRNAALIPDRWFDSVIYEYPSGAPIMVRMWYRWSGEVTLLIVQGPVRQ